MVPNFLSGFLDFELFYLIAYGVREFLSQHSALQFKLGQLGIGLNHLPTTNSKLAKKTAEFRINQKTEVDSIYDQTPIQFYDSTSTPK